MSRLKAIDPKNATGMTKALLDGVQKKIGATPNIFRVMANSPALLQGYLGLNGALAGGDLEPGLREQISLAVSGLNGCEYCTAAHAALGKMAGLSPQQIQAALDQSADDARGDAAVRFASALVRNRGTLSDADFNHVRSAGFGDSEIGEIIGMVAVTTLTNYFNIAAQVEVDFPKFTSVAA